MYSVEFINFINLSKEKNPLHLTSYLVPEKLSGSLIEFENFKVLY